MSKKSGVLAVLFLLLLLFALLVAPDLIELSVYQSSEVVGVSRTKDEPDEANPLNKKLALVNSTYQEADDSYLEKEKIEIVDNELEKLFKLLGLGEENLLPIYAEPTIYGGSVFWRGQFIMPEQNQFFGSYIMDDETEKIVQLVIRNYEPLNQMEREEIVERFLAYLELAAKKTKKKHDSYQIELVGGETIDFSFDRSSFYFNTGVQFSPIPTEEFR